MKIESREVMSRSFEYRDYLCEKSSFVTLTEWINGEGFDVEWGKCCTDQRAALSHADIDAFLAIISASRVDEPNEE